VIFSKTPDHALKPFDGFSFAMNGIRKYNVESKMVPL